MKNLFLFLLLSTISCFSGHTQGLKTEFTKSLESINVVVLKLSGSAIIRSSATDELRINSFLNAGGTTYGWRFPDKRPEFSILCKISKDTIYLSTPVKFSPKTIGIDTYSEAIENFCQLPAGKKIIVAEANILKIEGELRDIDIMESKSITLIVPKSKVKELSCEALKNVQVNLHNVSKTYEFNSTGENSYTMKAEQITVTLK